MLAVPDPVEPLAPGVVEPPAPGVVEVASEFVDSVDVPKVTVNPPAAAPPPGVGMPLVVWVWPWLCAAPVCVCAAPVWVCAGWEPLASRPPTVTPFAPDPIGLTPRRSGVLDIRAYRSGYKTGSTALPSQRSQ